MKNKYFVLLIITLNFTGCIKNNDLPELPACEVSRVTLGRLLPDYPYLFKKIYDPSGKFVREMHLTFYSVTAMPMMNFLFKYESNKLLVINKDNLNDVVMKVEFNSKGRPHRIATSETFFEIKTTFTYRNNRLDSVIVKGENINSSDKCYYDNFGNILSIKRFEPMSNQYVGSFYTYDYSKTIRHAFYQDEPRFAPHFGFAVLQYLHFFPELNPRNVRIHSLVGLEDRTAHLQNDRLGQHIVDSEGRLVSYKGPDENIFASIEWKCARKRPSD
jgi:hypothetical protein